MIINLTLSELLIFLGTSLGGLFLLGLAVIIMYNMYLILEMIYKNMIANNNSR